MINEIEHFFICLFGRFNILFCEVPVKVFTYFPVESSIFFIDLWEFFVYYVQILYQIYVLLIYTFSVCDLPFHSLYGP